LAASSFLQRLASGVLKRKRDTLTEGLGIRATARITGVDRGTVGALALRLGRGCAELHDRMMVGVRTNRLELDETWSFVGKKQKRVKRHETFAKGDQYVFVGIAGTQKAIITDRALRYASTVFRDGDRLSRRRFQKRR
jgi:hypothetical protein